MESGLRLLLTNAAAAGALACVALVVSRLVRRPALAHALWLLALVKLVTPPVLPLPLLPDWSEPPPAPAPLAAPANARLQPVTAPAARPEPFPLASEPVALAPTPLPARAPDRSTSLRFAIVALLASGAVAVLGLAAFRFARFRSVLAWAEPAAPPLQARAAALAAALGLSRPPPVLVVPAQIPPMLWPEASGPLLLLPRALLAELTEAECSALLAHELAHVRRRDHWVRLVELLATAVFWWYPVTWWARSALRRAEERCCDEWVLRVLPRSAPAYAQGLLKTLTFVSSAPAAVPALASGASPLPELELRLKEILMSRPAPRLASPVRLALAGAALLGLAVYPTQAREDAPRAAAAPAAPATPRTPAPSARAPRAASPVSPAPAAAPQAPAAPRSAETPMSPPPAAPARAATPAAPAAPAAPVDAARRALEDQRRALESKRLRLQQEELEIQRQEIELRARAEAAELRQAEKIAALEAGGATDRAEAERRAVEDELTKKQREMEDAVRAIEKEMRQVEKEEQVHAVAEATDELARSIAERAEELEASVRETGRSPDIDRELERLRAALAALHPDARPKP